MAHVLILDDELEIRKLVRKVLSTHNHTVLEAENANQAISILRENHVDIAIVDLVLPRKGGIETLMEIREFNKQIKLVAMSGKIQTEGELMKRIADQFKVDAVLAKPFDIDRLLKLVQDLA